MGKEKDNLRIKTASSSMAMASLSMVMKPLNLVSSIILARWLAPEFFGTVALAMILIGFANMFTGLGLGVAVIHSPYERSKIAFNSFVITSLSGLILALLIAVSAVPLARLLGDVQVAPYLRVLTLLIVLHGLVIVPTSLLKKDMQFGRVAQISVFAQFAYIGIGLILAYFGYGVWSLVFARITSVFTTTLLTWFACPGWDWLVPRALDKKIIRDLLGYGMHITRGRTLGYIIENWDDWLVGRYLGTASLGFYSRAYDYMDKNVIQISGNIIGGVLLSTFSRLQDDLARLQKIYLKAVRLIWLLIVPISLGVVVLAQDLVPVLLGANWNPMVPALQIFSFMILTRAFSHNTSSLFSAVGRPEIIARGATILLVVFVPFTLLFLQFDITGVALSALISDFFGVSYFLIQANRILPGTSKKMITSGIPMLLAGILMVVVVQLSKPFVFDVVVGTRDMVALFLLTGIGAVVYLGVMFIIQRSLMRELIILAWDVLNEKGRLSRFLPGRSMA
jgi:lipopolysaccharide exporter